MFDSTSRDPKQDNALKFLAEGSIGVSEGEMTSMGEIGEMLTASDETGAFVRSMGLQKGASDRSLTGVDRTEEDTLLEALGLSDERKERIRKLKAAIAGGRYFVTSGELAERLMTRMLAD